MTCKVCLGVLYYDNKKLEAENARLRKALEKIATSDQYVNKSEIARDALEGR